MWLSTLLGLMSLIEDIVAVYISTHGVMGKGIMAVYISMLDVMGRSHCGCLHF